MDTSRLKQATQSRWKWLMACWVLMGEAKSLLLTIDALNKELMSEKESHHLTKLELRHQKSLVKEYSEESKSRSEANGALLEFIQKRHGQNMPVLSKGVSQSFDT